MPLAFTQEDFLVDNKYIQYVSLIAGMKKMISKHIIKDLLVHVSIISSKYDQTVHHKYTRMHLE